jgi:tetratricopeptide (TPR) repeat protein
VSEFPDAVRAGGIEVALLRRLDRAAEGREALARWRQVDPTGNLLRHEAVLLGADDPSLWQHLAGDPDRVLGLAEDYMALGFFREAIELLARAYPTGSGVMAELGTPAPQEHPLVAYYRGYCRERAGGSGAADYGAAAVLPTRYVFPSRVSTERVLRAALAANPRDATARFLLGSFLLSSGRADDAIAAWEETRHLNPRIPVLHRNLGLALLHSRADAEGALKIFLEGLDVDGGNTALYVGADEAQSLLGRPAEEHIKMLERYPDKAGMPPLLVEKLALALADAGRGEEAEALFAGRHFPREENGTNVRQVYIEVQVRRALGLAKAGKGSEAATLVEGLERPVAGLDFTRDGLGSFVQGSRIQYTIGEILAAAGRTEEARAHWSRAATAGDWPNVKAVFAHLAARRLAGADSGASTSDWDASLTETEAFIEHGTAFPGIAVYAEGLLLRALGREDEARARLRSVFLLPDLRLSHFLSRRALEAHDPL